MTGRPKLNKAKSTLERSATPSVPPGTPAKIRRQIDAAKAAEQEIASKKKKAAKVTSGTKVLDEVEKQLLPEEKKKKK